MTLRPGAIIDYEDEQVAVIRHDARALPLDDGSVDLIVTSPPYFALRSYRDDGKHFDGQIGSEDSPDEWLDNLDACMVEWGRVLKPSGSVWINLGDKYAGSGGHNNAALSPQGMHVKRGDHDNPKSAAAKRSATRREAPDRYNQATSGVPAKSLMGLPWRFAIRQIDAGWILRAEVVWDKPNGLPESVTDRVRRSHEQWFHFTRASRYFPGIDEIRDPHADPIGGSATTGRARVEDGGIDGGNTPIELNPLGRLPGSVWRIPSEPLLIPDDTRQALDLPDHFAAFPQEWPRRIILGWSPTGICTVCGEGRRPVVDVSDDYAAAKANANWVSGTADGIGKHRKTDRLTAEVGITGYVCACPTPDAPTTPAIVLDPFGGTGTVAGVAKTLGRSGISNDLSESYNRLAIWRITQSGHFTKTEQRAWADRQGSLL